ncbi:MAG: hypothetical protein CMM93_04800 [Rickettsiales bacterium]|nr:hypothetical protein [Rickettsiales bacterium]
MHTDMNISLIDSIILYDDHGNVDGELSLHEIRNSVEKRREALDLLFDTVTESDVRAAHALLHEASSWEVRLETLLHNRTLTDADKQMILHILHIAASDELERSIKYNGIRYKPNIHVSSGRKFSATELIDLVIRGQAVAL